MTARFATLTILFAATFVGALPVLAQKAPAPDKTSWSPEVLSLACAPTIAFEAPAADLRVTGGQDSFFRRSYVPGDLVTINAGAARGIEVGQEYFVRRVQKSARESINRTTPATIRTTGWIRIYAVDEKLSLATVSHACDSIEVDDYLEPLTLPTPVVASAERPAAQRENYGRVLSGQDRRRSFGRDDYLVVNRGSDHGVEVGTHFVLYRDKRVADNFLYVLGEAVAVDVKSESSTLRVTVSSDAILAGDYVAMRR